MPCCAPAPRKSKCQNLSFRLTSKARKFKCPSHAVRVRRMPLGTKAKQIILPVYFGSVNSVAFSMNLHTMKLKNISQVLIDHIPTK
jgi:hypothetical protein